MAWPGLPWAKFTSRWQWRSSGFSTCRPCGGARTATAALTDSALVVDRLRRLGRAGRRCLWRARRYDTPDGSKSVEGSVAFFLSAFLCCHVPLLLLGERDRPETLLIAALLALLAMMFEAIAWAGLDNLILPLVAYLLLGIYWDLHAGCPADAAGSDAWVLGLRAVFLAVGDAGRHAVLGAVLVGYICWALGGWAWTVPPLLLYVGYTFVSPATELNSQKTHSMHAVVSVSAAGMIWLFLAQLQGRPEWFFPFTVAFAAAAAR